MISRPMMNLTRARYWSCNTCLGDFAIEAPFLPRFCPHCGIRVEVAAEIVERVLAFDREQERNA